MVDREEQYAGDAARDGQRRLAAIARAASGVADTGSLRVTLDEVAREAARAEHVAAVQILLVEGGRMRVVGKAGFTDGDDFPELLEACRRRGAQLKFAQAFHTGEPVVVPHRRAAIMNDPAWEPLHPVMGAAEWDGLVAVPLRVRRRVLGVLNVYHRPGAGLDSDAVEFLEAVADLAAMAVDAAELLGRSRRDAVVAERARLARDLHDSAVQHVFSIRMQAAALRDSIAAAGDLRPQRVRDVADELAALAQRALSDLRGLVLQLHPADLMEIGLTAAVRRHAESVAAASGLQVDLDLEHLDAVVPTELAEDLLRIVQEALHNVVKHAAASRAAVSLRADEGPGRSHVDVVVGDDGRGTGGRPLRPGGLGLASMRERALRWGGTATAGDDADGFGVHVRVPTPSPLDTPR